MKNAIARRSREKAHLGGAGFAMVGRILAKLSRALPKPKNALVAVIEIPYVVVVVALVLALLLPMLAVLVIWLLLRLIFVLPRTIVLTVASKTTLTAGSHVAGRGEPSEPGEPLSPPQVRTERDRQLALMAGGDDPTRVTAEALDRAEKLWLLWQRSIALQDSDMMRPAMAEGFWRVQRMLLELRQEGGVERVFDGRVIDAGIVAATHSGIVDELRVRLTCEGTCYDRTVNPEVVLRGSAGSSQWREEVGVRRSSDVRAMAPAGGVPTACPNCGAPLDVTPEGACRTCRALVAGPPDGWVLADAWREQW